jgi:hypothetical protein
MARRACEREDPPEDIGFVTPGMEQQAAIESGPIMRTTRQVSKSTALGAVGLDWKKEQEALLAEQAFVAEQQGPMTDEFRAMLKEPDAATKLEVLKNGWADGPELLRTAWGAVPQNDAIGEVVASDACLERLDFTPALANTETSRFILRPVEGGPGVVADRCVENVSPNGREALLELFHVVAPESVLKAFLVRFGDVTKARDNHLLFIDPDNRQREIRHCVITATGATAVSQCMAVVETMTVMACGIKDVEQCQFMGRTVEVHKGDYPLLNDRGEVVAINGVEPPVEGEFNVLFDFPPGASVDVIKARAVAAIEARQDVEALGPNRGGDEFKHEECRDDTLDAEGLMTRWRKARAQWCRLFNEAEIPMALNAMGGIDDIEGMIYDKIHKGLDPKRCACGCNFVLGCMIPVKPTVEVFEKMVRSPEAETQAEMDRSIIAGLHDTLPVDTKVCADPKLQFVPPEGCSDATRAVVERWGHGAYAAAVQLTSIAVNKNNQVAADRYALAARELMTAGWHKKVPKGSVPGINFFHVDDLFAKLDASCEAADAPKE